MDVLQTNSSDQTSAPENGSCLFFQKECPDMAHGTYAYRAAKIFTLLVATPCCAYVLRIPATGRCFKSLTEVASYNCIASDALFCVGLSLELVNIFLGSYVLAHIGFFFHGFNLLGRPLFLFSVCVDRYLAVAHPHFYQRLKKAHTARMTAMTLIWVMSVAFCLTLGLTSFAGMPLAAGAFILAVTVIILSLSGVLLRDLWRKGPGTETVHPMKRAALGTVAVSLARLLLFYLPIVAVSLAFSITGTDYCSDFGVMSCVLVPFSFAMTTLSSGMGPLYILYKLEVFSCCLTPPAGQQRPH